MILRQLRLTAFKRFARPVQVTGFDGGLNVLAADNETGKSTIFEALETVFLLPYNRSGGPIEALRPYGGGEPRIEVDLEIEGRRWRMAKQYGRGKAAILTNIDTAREEARGDEAEQRFANLVGLAGEGRPDHLGLVWVRQQRTLLAPDPDLDPETRKYKARGEANALTDAVGQEVAAAAGGEAAARVAARVKAALETLVQPSRAGPKKNGPLDLALRADEAASHGLQAAIRLAAESEGRLAAIGALIASLAELDTPTRRATAERQIDEHERQIASAAQTRAARDLARQALETRTIEAETAEKARRDFEKSLSDAGRLAEEREISEQTRKETVLRLTSARSSAEALAEQASRIEIDLQAVAEKLALCDRVEQRKSLQARVAALKSANEQAHGLETEILVRTQAIAANGATPERLARLSALESIAAIAAAELSASAPVVEIKLDPAAAGRVRLDGSPLEADSRVAVDGHLDIDIEGIAAIRVNAADAGQLAGIRRRRDEAAQEIALLIEQISAKNSDDARARAAARTDETQTVATMRATLAAIAPSGRSGLAAELGRLLEELGTNPVSPVDMPPRNELVASRAEVLARRDEIAARLRNAEDARQAADRELAGLDAAALQRAERMAAFAVELPPEPNRRVEREKLQARAVERELAAREARLSYEALRQAALSDEDFCGLSTALEAKRSDHKRHDDEVRRMRLELERLMSAQSVIDDEGRAGQVPAAQDEVQRTGALVRRLEAEVQALSLLARTLAAAKERTRAQYFEPVMQRLAPYLAYVFPEAGIGFKDAFTLESITRAGQRETFATLSDGTREQLAVLVRMSFARLLADRGRAAPLVLDDPLVYSDDNRLAAMCQAQATVSWVRIPPPPPFLIHARAAGSTWARHRSRVALLPSPSG